MRTSSMTVMSPGGSALCGRNTTYGVLPTWTAASPGVSAGEVLASMIAFTLVYGIIAVIVLKLFFRQIGKGLPEVHPAGLRTDPDAPLSFAY